MIYVIYRKSFKDKKSHFKKTAEFVGRELCCRVSWPRAMMLSQLAAGYVK